MNILYLHGLDSTLSNQKRAILENFGEVLSPIMDYRNNERVFDKLVNEFIDVPIDVIMGSSMGGFVGYFLANKFQIPSLLFNPAVPYRSVKQEIVKEKVNFKSNLQIVLGMQDDVIKPMDTLMELAKLPKDTKLVMHLHHQMGHRIPLDVFKKEVTFFFSNIKTT
jgi:predicted esterase YcpF (UPF0227 family)